MIQPHIIILSLVAVAFIPEVIWIVRLFRNKAQEGALPKITLRINIIVFVLGLLLTGIAVMYDINFVRYKAPIRYSEVENINWSDFRAIKRPHQTLQGINTFAFIMTDITVSVSGNRAEIISRFHPARSYTFSEDAAGENLLQHELYHFHITEYFARQMRKEFSETGSAEFLNLYLHREREMQSTYDEESAHGYLLGKQRKWQTDIDSCLLSLEQFAEPVVQFNPEKK